MRLLLVFLKEPIPGQVKTRLAIDVGDDQAARYYTAMVEVLLLQLRGLSNCRIRFCYAPDDAQDAIRFWLLPKMGATSSESEGVYVAPTYSSQQSGHQEIDFRPQGEGHLGERLSKAFEEGFEDGYESIAVIGTDCPECGARWINAAFSRLEASTQRHGVIGPSHDGGYYLLATKAYAPQLFENISWSSSEVCAETISASESCGMIMEKLPPLHDIDTLTHWQRALASPLGPAMRKALGEEIEADDVIDLDV